MYHVKLSIRRKPLASYLDLFLEKFWFIPSDVLQRGMEANIWHLLEYKRPILDIGIGNGKLTPLIFKKISEFDVGVDIDKSGLEEAKRSGVYKKVLLENAEKMSFKDNSFHTIVSNSTFEHIRNDKKAIQEISRVLKKNGKFMFTVPSNFLKEWILESELKRTSDKSTALANLEEFNKRANHLHYRSLEEWKKILNDAGLEIEYSSHYFRKDVALFWYRLFKWYTKRIRNKEVWSYLHNTKFLKIIPNGFSKALTKQMLKKYYYKGFLLKQEDGAQMVIIARKK